MGNGWRRAINNLARAARVGSLLLGASLPIAAFAQSAAEPNAVENVAVSAAPGGKVLVRVTLRQGLAKPPAGFTVDTPPRIAVDLPNTVNASGKTSVEVGEGDLRSMNLVQATGRTRLVLNLARPMSYEMQIQDRVLLLALTPAPVGSSSSNVTPQFAQEVPGSGAHAVRDVDFRRGANGEGRVVVALSDSAIGIDIRRQGKLLLVDFVGTKVPSNLVRRLDVGDFGTPVKFVDMVQSGANARLTIEPTGNWEHSAYQTENQFVVEVQTIKEDPTKLVQGPQPYAGEKLSLNFQNVEVRSVLQVIADFTGLNIITSDTVGGNLTLRLKDVPWDQALDIILRSKGLDKRKNGNVILIAPKEELAAREKLELEAKAQVADLEPLVTESIKLKYQRAEEVKRILDSGGAAGAARILSKRGSAVLDARSNTLFVQDVPSRLDELRKLINEIDVAQRQVLIEARIVIADDKFSRQLGARFGAQNGFSPGNKSVGVSGNLTGSDSIATGAGTAAGNSGNLNVNLPVANAAGSLALTILNLGSGNLINVELSALEVDGRGKVISSPRVITADKQEATIEQGTEIPYQTRTSSGATDVQFKPAVLSLKVTPQITPDDKVIMILEVKKDAVGQIFAGVPSIDTKKVFTRILVDNGETAVLGGIYEQVIRTDVNKVPLFGDIPVLGYLFKNTERRDEKTELLIFITPKILKEGMALR